MSLIAKSTTDSTELKSKSKMSKISSETNEQKGTHPETNLDVVRKSRTWMEKPIIKESDLLQGLSEGLEFLVPLTRLYIYERIAMVDTMMDKAGASTNMLTVRNDTYQQVYYVVTSHDRRPGRYKGFKYRIIDQYARHIFTMVKYFRLPICGKVEAEIRCPPGHCAARITQLKEDSVSLGYRISRPDGHSIIDLMRESKPEASSSFDIMLGNKVVGKIAKRSERDHIARNVDPVYDKDFVRIDFPTDMKIFEKLVVFATALLINVIHFKDLKTF
ncbi:hypothetical protein HDE_08196 [Halotydeus destructor]|nr:hypothetical protein HDE_08196 [Halotydeus destructor]